MGDTGSTFNPGKFPGGVQGFKGQTLPTADQNIFSAYNKYLPTAMQGNQPITDPSAILQAYTSNLPAMLQAGQNTNVEGGNARLPVIGPGQQSDTWQQWLAQYKTPTVN